MNTIRGNFFDLQARCFYKGEIYFDDFILEIRPVEECPDVYLFPGLVDAHVHIESSMLSPVEFSRLIVSRGTIAVVSDPHEIANVMGLSGVDYMIDNSRLTPLKCFFGAPSCVPATNAESSGACLGSSEVSHLLARPDVFFLSEMMNFPGVISSDSDVMAKINAAKSHRKPIDGHAPWLTKNDLVKYAGAGISTDHECFTIEDALLKIEMGMKVQIREGSAARNFEALWPLIASHPFSVMLCTDDSHPDDLISLGHIDKIIKMGLQKGLSIFDLVRVAVYNPVSHYQLPVGLLRVGDPADMIVVDHPDAFNILETYIDGRQVFNRGKVAIESVATGIINNFNTSAIDASSIQVFMPETCSSVRVIGLTDGELVTSTELWIPDVSSSREVTSSTAADILKVVVLNRYMPSMPSVGFVSGFGLKRGAIGSSIAHDSHHIIAVGVTDDDIVTCINSIIQHKGGVVVSDNSHVDILPLPIAGIMSDQTGLFVSEKYQLLQHAAANLGSDLRSPFMSLSFMSLLVIPSLKIGAKGLFDVNRFEFVDLFV